MFLLNFVIYATGVGIDTPSLDYGPSTTFDTHLYLLDKNVYFLENVGDTSALPAAGKGKYNFWQMFWEKLALLT